MSWERRRVLQTIGVVGLFGVRATAATAATTITGWSELAAIPDGSEDIFRLGANLDATGKQWDPIKNFKGTFNGNGYTISNLVVDQSHNGVGLFGSIEGNGSVQRLGLENVSVTGNIQVGGLAGRNSGTVSESYVTGSVSGEQIVGGIAGKNRGVIQDSYAMGNASGDEFGRVGGIAGRNFDGAKIENSYAVVEVSGDRTGGVVGENNESEVETSYWDTEATGQSNSDGGVGLTTAEMQEIGFSDVWESVNEADGWTRDGYPVLSNLDKESQIHEQGIQRTGIINGTVTDRDGNQLEDVELKFVNEDVTATTKTSGGDYEIAIAGDILHNVTVNKDGYVPVEREVAVSEEGTRTENFTLDIRTVSGRITSDGNPVSDVSVSFDDTKVTTDSDGRYAITGLHSDTLYEVNVNKDHYLSEVTEVSLERDQANLNLNFKLQESSIVEGIVTDPDGNPVGGVNVEFTETVVTTGENGEYSVELAVGTTHNVTANKDGYESDSGQITVSGTEPNILTFEIRGIGDISGTVKDVNGEPVSDVTIMAGNNATETSDDGEYSINLTAQTYDIIAEKDNYETETGTVSLSPGESKNKNFTIAEKTGTVMGTVENTNKEGIGQVTVEFVTDKGTNSITTSSNGTYEISLVANRHYDIFTRKDGYEVGRGTVTVGTDETHTHNFAISRYGTISGAITDTNENPLSNARITIDSIDTDQTKVVYTDSAGKYEINMPIVYKKFVRNKPRTIREQTFKISVEQSEHRSRQTRIRLETGEKQTVSFTLPSRQSLEGYANQENGEIESSGALDAITDWQNNEISNRLVLDVIDAWITK